MANRCAIVGGGASGALAALAIGRRTAPPSVTLFEPRPELGRGFAYSTARREHVLNVPAGRLSADPGDPGDFVAWCRANGVAAAPDDFVPRRAYGRYLGERSSDGVEHVTTRVVDLARCTDGRLEVRTVDGHRDTFDDVVIATGYGPAPGQRAFPAVESPQVVRDPYAPGAFDAVARRGEIVVVGTGLTAIDVILVLAVDRPGQPILAVSRRGRAPALHDLAIAPIDVPTTAVTARGLLRELRDAVSDAALVGGDWRSVVDGFRPHLPEVWRSLPVDERARLLRHARRPWDIHRHRLAPTVAARLAALIDAGRVTIRRGTPTAIEACGRRLSVTLTPAFDGAATVVDAAGVVLCTGVIDDDWMAADPLLGQLVGRGLATPDALGIGPAVDRSGRLVGLSGGPTPGLWAIGPLRRAAEWEVTAIPEIRQQAATLAAAIVA